MRRKSRICCNCAYCQTNDDQDRTCRHPDQVLLSVTIVSAEASCRRFIDRDDTFVEISDEYDRLIGYQKHVEGQSGGLYERV